MRIQKYSPLLVLIFSFFTIFSVAQETARPESPQSAAITGTVLDVNGGAIGNAQVLLQAADSNDRASYVTQGDGAFEFRGLKAGVPYHITVSAHDFATWNSNEITLQAGEFHILSGVKLRLQPVAVAMNVVPAEELAIEQVKAEEQQRVLGFIPNFYIAYNHDAAPLTKKLKFKLMLRTLDDPVTITGVGLNAAMYQALNYPRYGHGAAAFGERLGATFADGYTNALISDAVLPALLHQDPRYFYQGTGTTSSRLRHALSSAFMTRGDDGREHINYSAIGGDLAAGAMSNAYYPERDRGAKLVLTSAATGMVTRMLTNVLQEFVLPRFTERPVEQDAP
jgi:hypothetical protein